MNNYEKEEWGVWKIVSDMLDKPDKFGIYPTSDCYQRLYNFVCEQKRKAKQEERERIKKIVLPKNMEWNGEECDFDTAKAIGFNRCLKQVENNLKELK